MATWGAYFSLYVKKGPVVEKVEETAAAGSNDKSIKSSVENATTSKVSSELVRSNTAPGQKKLYGTTIDPAGLQRSQSNAARVALLFGRGSGTPAPISEEGTTPPVSADSITRPRSPSAATATPSPILAGVIGKVMQATRPEPVLVPETKCELPTRSSAKQSVTSDLDTLMEDLQSDTIKPAQTVAKAQTFPTKRRSPKGSVALSLDNVMASLQQEIAEPVRMKSPPARERRPSKQSLTLDLGSLMLDLQGGAGTPLVKEEITISRRASPKKPTVSLDEIMADLGGVTVPPARSEPKAVIEKPKFEKEAQNVLADMMRALDDEDDDGGGQESVYDARKQAQDQESISIESRNFDANQQLEYSAYKDELTEPDDNHELEPITEDPLGKAWLRRLEEDRLAKEEARRKRIEDEEYEQEIEELRARQERAENDKSVKKERHVKSEGAKETLYNTKLAIKAEGKRKREVKREVRERAEERLIQEEIIRIRESEEKRRLARLEEEERMAYEEEIQRLRYEAQRNAAEEAEERRRYEEQAAAEVERRNRENQRQFEKQETQRRQMKEEEEESDEGRPLTKEQEIAKAEAKIRKAFAAMAEQKSRGVVAMAAPMPVQMTIPTPVRRDNIRPKMGIQRNNTMAVTPSRQIPQQAPPLARGNTAAARPMIKGGLPSGPRGGGLPSGPRGGLPSGPKPRPRRDQ